MPHIPEQHWHREMAEARIAQLRLELESIYMTWPELRPNKLDALIEAAKAYDKTILREPTGR